MIKFSWIKLSLWTSQTVDKIGRMWLITSLKRERGNMLPSVNKIKSSIYNYRDYDLLVTKFEKIENDEEKIVEI